MSKRRRLERLEGLAGVGPGETEREHEERRREIRKEAERMNDSLEREDKDPAFDVAANGDVFCSRDGRPVTEYRQTLAEHWYWWTLEELGYEGLVHDEEEQTFYTRSGELALSRDRVDFPRYMGKERWEPLG